MGRDLGDRLDLDALPVQALDLGLDLVRRRHEVVEAAGPVDPPGNELRVPGEQAQDIDVLEEPDVAAVGLNGEPPPVVAGHQQQRVEHEIVEADRGDVERANVPDRRIERKAFENDRLGEVHAGHDANPIPVTDEQGIDVAVAHVMPRILDGHGAVDENGRAVTGIPHARPQNGLDALRSRLLDEGIELARDFKVEEGREGRIAPDQVLNNRPWDAMAERLFGGEEVLASGPVYDGARIEAVLGAEHGLERVAGPILDSTLDDDVEELRGASLLDDSFATPEIADVERGLEFFNLLVGQAIEGWIKSVKSLHPRRRSGSMHVSPPRADAGLRADVLLVEEGLLLLGALAGVHLRKRPDAEKGDGHREQGGVVVGEDLLRITEGLHPHRLAEHHHDDRADHTEKTADQGAAGGRA